MTQITEWWVIPVDEHGDSIDIYPCKSRNEAIKERDYILGSHPCAARFDLQRVVRKFHNDGQLYDETITDESW